MDSVHVNCQTHSDQLYVLFVAESNFSSFKKHLTDLESGSNGCNRDDEVGGELARLGQLLVEGEAEEGHAWVVDGELLGSGRQVHAVYVSSTGIIHVPFDLHLQQHSGS